MSVTQFTANELVSRNNVNSRVTEINNMFPVSVANGGTGQTTLPSGNILLGHGTSGVDSTAVLPVSKGGTGITSVPNGNILVGTNTGDITSISCLSVVNGGTGKTTLPSGEILLGNGTGNIDSTATLPVTKGGTGGTTATEARTNLAVMTGDSLYYNASGTTGTVTLSSSVANYKGIEILFFITWSSNNWYNSVRIYNNNASEFRTNISVNVGATYGTSDQPRVKVYGSNILVSGTSITRITNKMANITGSNTTSAIDATDDTPKIYGVIGYKY